MNKLITALTLTFVCAMAAPAAQLRVSVKDQHGRPVSDAVVLATPDEPKSALRAKPPPDTVDQVDKQFVPYVKPIYVGSRVRFPNSDHIRHQVYSFSPAKKSSCRCMRGPTRRPLCSTNRES